MRLAPTIVILVAVPFQLHAEDQNRPYLEDIDGRYHLELQVSKTSVVVGASLPTTFCLSTTRGEPVEACLGWMQGISAWAGQYGQTVFVLPHGDVGSCSCKEVVTLEPDRPYCWPMMYAATGLGSKSVDLSAFVTVLEGVREMEASVPTCVEVESKVVKIAVELESSDDEPAGD